MKTAYKNTEVGVIPSDWEVKELGEIGKFKNGINKSSEDFGFGFPFVNLMDVFGKSSISQNENFGLINSNEIERKLYDLKKGDVLFIRSSVKPSGVGLTCVIENNLSDIVFSGFIIRYRDNNYLEEGFKKHCFYSERFRNSLIGSSTVSANTNINQEALKKLKIPIPPTLAEQKFIATALSDADALISSLEKLIAKKRNIKQGAMQKLLQPKKSWEVKQLGEVAELTSSKRIFENEYVSNGIPFYRGKEISLLIENKRLEDEYFISQDRYNEIKRNFGVPKEGEILITAVGTLGNIYRIPDDNKFYFKDGNLIWLRNIRDISSKYLSIQLKWLKDEIVNNAIGSSQKALTIWVLKKQKIPLPILAEQTRIATILSDMDAEIAALESKLEKYRKVKLGMMQNLLTGKIRLV